MRKCSLEDDPEERRKRAMQDPEIQQILQDPAMQMILQQMQENPGALREYAVLLRMFQYYAIFICRHLQNPHIATKLEKLLQSGIIGLR